MAQRGVSVAHAPGQVLMQVAPRNLSLQSAYESKGDAWEWSSAALLQDGTPSAAAVRAHDFSEVSSSAAVQRFDELSEASESFNADLVNVSCPESGLFEHGKCWYLSDRKEDCMTACARQGLAFSWFMPQENASMLPRLLGFEPGTRLEPWGTQECYDDKDNEYHPALADGEGALEPQKLKKFNCSLACPCSPDPAYALAGTGVAGPAQLWNIGSAQGQGAAACFAAVLNEKNCYKEYFSYRERGDQSCGCKSTGDALSVTANSSSDYYVIGTELLYRPVGSFADVDETALRYGPRKKGYDAITCLMACSTYTYFGLQGNGWCGCDNYLVQITQYGPASDCSPLGAFNCNYLFTSDLTKTPAPTPEGPEICGDFDVKLENAINGRGTPMLYINGLWQPICSHDFDVNQYGANILCRQLGYEYGALWLMNATNTEWNVFVQTCQDPEATTLQACQGGGPVASGTQFYDECFTAKANAIEVQCFGGSPQALSCGFQPPSPAPTPAPPAITSGGDEALFLMQATFGPTRSELLKLLGTTKAAWVQEQMSMPMELHRVAYRSLVNPMYDDGLMPGYYAKTQCVKGSRWIRRVFVLTDCKKPIVIKDGGQIWVDGVRRGDIDRSYVGNGLTAPQTCSDVPTLAWQGRGQTCAERATNGDISQECETDETWRATKLCRQSCFNIGMRYAGDDCSGGWVPYADANYTGFVCEVADGWVTLSTSQNCGTKEYLQNPTIWFASGVQETSYAFQRSTELPDLILLDEIPPVPCELEGATFVNYSGGIYRHETRMGLRENTVENPSALPAIANMSSCVPKTMYNEDGCLLQSFEDASSSGCYALCGSPGEISNVPARGHQLPWRHDRDTPPDKAFDNRYFDNIRTDHGRSIVWVSKAMNASDQLRQRVAWALAQILVIGSEGKDENEEFANFYDIFVRNAFGNYRDLLREVTYSPVMGRYVTYVGSRSLDASGSSPDENYAREIMELFTIGLYMLYPNGTIMLNQDGTRVDTYSNEEIMNFARVFSGFQRQENRANIEAARFNEIDPMRMEASDHDVYPKPDLFQGYLGDMYPLCTEIPARTFLLAGATYEFLGYAYDGSDFEVLVLSAESPLYQALSNLSFTVNLASSLECHGNECGKDDLGVVKVGKAFYRYVPPVCVYHYFYNGKRAMRADFAKESWCVNELLPLASTACCGPCNTWIQAFSSKGSEGLTCSDDANIEYTACNHSSDQVTLQTAQSKCSSLGLHLCDRDTDRGCFARTIAVWEGSNCSLNVTVHEDGKVYAHTDNPHNRFTVYWTNGTAAPAGNYSATVTVQPVFTKVPTKSEVGVLKIGAFAPTINCTHGCSSKVKGYAPSGDIDVDTVYEYEGQFYKNAESVVHIGAYAFRNPPVFIRPGPKSVEDRDEDVERAAMNEVEALLDHLFYHPNTPVFVSKRLIQRFTHSNPDASYLETVVKAFETGTYDGVVYSGKYGDLGATVAAILCNYKARKSTTSTTDGMLREPILKLMHLLRAFGYEDAFGEQNVLNRLLIDEIGQFPYESATVFNFFEAEFQPASFLDGAGQDASVADLVAPEFQIFTTPFAVMFLNGIDALLTNGLGKCSDGFGIYDLTHRCTGKGTFSFTESSTFDATLRELNILLTGGRLTDNSEAVVQTSYEQAAQGKGLGAAQRALVLTPEFNNFGDPKPVETPVSLSTQKALTQTERSNGYKAIVLLFLHGGVDSYHMLVPTDCPLYDEYKTRRTGAALEQAALLPITASNQECTRFGLHPAMTFTQELYETRNKAAFMSDVGALVEPLTKQQYKYGGAQVCLSLFSHQHQRMAAQTLKCQIPGSSPRGAGGRIADALASQGITTSSFSIAGSATWSQGVDTFPCILHGNRGITQLAQYAEQQGAISNITGHTHENVFFEEYSHTLQRAVQDSESLGAFLSNNATLSTNYTITGMLSKQLMQVARVIATREARGAERDIFFVQQEGFDTHANLHEKLDELFVELDAALRDFVTELEGQGVFNQTVLITESDFGRTLEFNGDGTDHGWGGNYLVLGGAVNGGQMFNKFLKTYVEDNEYDVGRGRIIPQYPWENMLVPLSEWMGVADVTPVFPNLHRFNRSLHIASGLFTT